MIEMKTRSQKQSKAGVLKAEDPDPKSTVLSRRCRYGGDSVDRISELPDSILDHILSFLPSKNAVATRILSKRWNLVRMTVGNLDFRYPGHYVCEYDFVEFVNYVLLRLHKPAANLDRLSLTLETESVPIVQARIDSWICAAFARNVHDLFVSAKNFKLKIQTQRIMFGCEKLQSIELNCNFSISSETTFSLPRLESLKLTSINVQSQEAFCQVFGGCPVLKYLFMDFYMDNVSESVFRCDISSSSLRHLELYVRNKRPSTTTRGDICLIKLTAPSLEYIKLEDHVCLLWVKQKLNSLVEANIHLACLETLRRIEDSYICAVEAFQAFNCAKSLTLSAQVIQVLSCVRDKMTTKFERLTRLEVTTDRNHWSVVQDLINLSDGLEALTIKKDNRDTYENYLDNSNWEPPDLVPGCLSTSLRTVSIDVCDGHHSELAMVHYILKHGCVLQVMKICLDSTGDLRPKLEMVKKISTFSKRSPVCRVEFC